MVSVVIPTLNEAAELPTTLRALATAALGVVYETIVADGGSTDDTLAVAAANGCICVPVTGEHPQRASQMNAGAARATGAILLFLHADTILPASALAQVVAACAQGGVVGGAFARRYASGSGWLRLTCRLAEWRNRAVGWHLGDQAIFVRAAVFAELGGYGGFDVFEDVDLSRRLGRKGSLRTLRPPVISSARRFVEGGIMRRSLSDAWLMLRYLLGAPPQSLLSARRRSGL